MLSYVRFYNLLLFLFAIKNCKLKLYNLLKTLGKFRIFGPYVVLVFIEQKKILSKKIDEISVSKSFFLYQGHKEELFRPIWSLRPRYKQRCLGDHTEKYVWG